MEGITMPNFDATDAGILQTKQESFNRVEGPRVGDFLKIAPDTFLRFTYDWNDTIQTTDRPQSSAYGCGSFYLGNGYADYSGSLDSGIDKSLLRDTGETMDGSFWFFHHNWQQAHNGVDFTIPCRVFEKVS